MPRYRIDIAGSVRCYGATEIEASSIEAANAIADRMVRHPTHDARFPALDPQWRAHFDYEVLNVTPVMDL